MFLRTLVVSTLVATGLGAAAPAFAGECPADKVKADVVKAVTYGPKGVTDNVLSMIDLSKEKVAIAGHLMRVRRLEVRPGGIVPWHSHAERPALIYVVSGEIYENNSNCAIPILHKAGEVARETHTTSHWWQNTGKVPVTLLSFDIAVDPNDHTM